MNFSIIKNVTLFVVNRAVNIKINEIARVIRWDTLIT